jgi:hypothetical protein
MHLYIRSYGPRVSTTTWSMPSAAVDDGNGVARRGQGIPHAAGKQVPCPGQQDAVKVLAHGDYASQILVRYQILSYLSIVLW